MTKIKDIKAYEVLDSRGFPTVCASVMLENNIASSFSVPSGASTGKYEALELRDKDKNRYLGKGVLKAVNNIETLIKEQLIGEDSANQNRIDQILCELDGTNNKSKLGANATLAVSVACAKVSSLFSNTPLYRYLGGVGSKTLPVPMFNVLNGGAHADSGFDVQEFMIVPYGADTCSESIRWGVEVYNTLKEILKKEGHKISVGDEGGFAPHLGKNELALEKITKAIEVAGYKPGEQIGIILDVAASEFYNNSIYMMSADDGIKNADSIMLVELYYNWIKKYPIVGIEDGLSEDDWSGWAIMNKKLSNTVQLIGDDIFVTNIEKLQKGIDTDAGNAIIIKPNQIGTLTETIECIKMAQENNYTPIMANRSAETDDPFISTLSIALSVPQIKTGAPCRGERVSKYNNMMMIEKDLGDNAEFYGLKSFKRFL